MRGLEQGSRGASRSQQLRLVVALGCMLGAAVALPCAVQAQAAASEKRDAEARGLFDAGKAAFESGRFEVALERWQEAYALSGRPALQYNIGLALDRLRRDQDALEAFRAYLTWDSEGERAEEVKGRIEAIEKALAQEQAADSKQVASPAEAAATVAVQEGSTPLDGPGAEPSLTEQWWFWPTVGAVATGVLVGIVAAASGGEVSTERKEALQAQPGVGLNFQALRRSAAQEVSR